MVAGKQLCAIDAQHLLQAEQRGGNGALQTEDGVLRWLAQEYGIGYTGLDDIEPDKQLLSLFPARILLKEELLPLQRRVAPRWRPAVSNAPQPDPAIRRKGT